MIKDRAVKSSVKNYLETQRANGGLRVKDVAATLNLKVNSVRGAFLALEREGYIERVTIGLYRWKTAA